MQVGIPQERYAAFRHRHEDRRLLFLELDVGGNTPAIMKCPLWKMTKEIPMIHYVCINLEGTSTPQEIADHTVLAKGYMEKR